VYHQLTLTSPAPPSSRVGSVDLGKLQNLVPSCAQHFPLYHLAWGDVAISAANCLGESHPLVKYLLTKKARNGESEDWLVAAD